MSKELRVVKHMDDMSPEVVIKHINGSHTPLGGIAFFGKSRNPGDENEDLLRAWHKKSHDWGKQNGQPHDHTHGKAKG